MTRERQLSYLWHSIHLVMVGALAVVTVIGWKWSHDHRWVECRNEL